MIAGISLHIILILLSFVESVPHGIPVNQKYSLDGLSLDEAYLIVRNANYSHAIVLFGNKVVCEECDLENLMVVESTQNVTRVIDTKYAYSLQLQSWNADDSISCDMESYKFAEHGTYLIDVIEMKPNECIYSIKQIGNPSAYAAPAVIGILCVVIYVTLVQVWHHLYQRGYFARFRSNNIDKVLNKRASAAEASISPISVNQQEINVTEKTIHDNTANSNEPSSSEFNDASKDKTPAKKKASKRLRALDTFRGFSLMIMIFVNYGGGGYWFFDHSTWNGLTLADLVFPWFTWMMGVSIVLSQRSLRAKNVSKRDIFLKILRRTIILFVLGFTGQDDLTKLENLRIFGVLQRLAMCYFFTAIIVLALDKNQNPSNKGQPFDRDNDELPLLRELYNNIFQFWAEWLIVLISITIWLLITFLLKVPNCPTGYLGPGGRHEHGKYWNCTGGAAGYIDRLILGESHLYPNPTCKEIYDTNVPYDPEGIMGILTGILLCYLGVQAGHIFINCTRVHRRCINWLFFGVLCGSIGLILSNGGHSNSWIPINKNFWSLTFVLILSSLAFFNLTILYLIVDEKQWFTGAPFMWLGMNSIVIYICHDRFATSFPVQFYVDNTHAKQLAIHLYGAFFWSFFAAFMYYKGFFIAI